MKLLTVEVRCNLDFPKKAIIFNKINNNKEMKMNWEDGGYGIDGKKRIRPNMIHNRDASLHTTLDTKRNIFEFANETNKDAMSRN